MNFKTDWQARIFALALISSIEYAAQLALPFVPRDDTYFAACGSFNFITLIAMTVTDHRPLMADLAKLTFLQLMLQFIGWCFYIMYLPSQFYNWSIQIIVVATYARILWVGSDDRNYANYLDWMLVSRPARLWPHFTFGVSK